MSTLPPVAPRAAAAALDGLPPRLRKRLDGAVAALAGREAVREDGRVRVAVDDENAVVLTLTAGVVADAGDVVCSCLLAPDCLHRAAVLAAAPVAPDDDPAQPPAPEPEPDGASREPDGRDATAVPGSPVADEAVRAAAREVWAAGARVLAAGVAGAGAVRRTALLRAAHGARLAGLPGPAAAAARVARRLAEAAGGDPAFRLAELSADVAELLDAARLVARGAEGAAAAAGTARRAYRVSGTLRLHGLFAEPVVTASGYAGVVAHAVGEDGTRYTVADVAPGGPERLPRALAASVPGGAALSLRELGAGAGLLVDGARVSADGRLGGGAGVRTVRTRGGGDDGPGAAPWRVPAAEQVGRALAERGDDLLFLTGELAAVDGGPALAVDGGPCLRLLAPDDRPQLRYVDNLRLLTGCPGARVRLVARLDRARPGAVGALALSWTDGSGAPVRADLGLRSLNRASLPAAGPAPGPPDGAGPLDGPRRPPAAPPAGAPAEVEALRRAVTRAVEGGLAVVAAAADGRRAARLAEAGMPTGAACLAALDAAAVHRARDVLGRLLPGDPEEFAGAWLSAALYAAAVDRSLVAAAWGCPG